MGCPHENFMVEANVGRILDKDGAVYRYSVDVKVCCAECKHHFRFIGLPMGLDMNGAAVSPNGQEGRFAIYPAGETPREMRDDEPAGFRILNQTGD